MLKIKYNFDSSQISFIKNGGKVKGYIECDDIDLLSKIIPYVKNYKYIGNTSNILFLFEKKDIYLIRYINRQFIVLPNKILMGSSLSLNRIYQNSLKYEFSGFDAIGLIPGFLGGAIINNASCFNQEISSFLDFIILMDQYGNIKKIDKKMIDFSYHKSSLESSNLIICAVFNYHMISKNKLKESHARYFNIKKATQPLDKLTLGSLFSYNGKVCVPYILDHLGLKGFCIGNIKISEKHANFIEFHPNELENIRLLIEEVKMILYNNVSYYIDLEIEIIS